MAERLARKVLRRLNLEDKVEVASAGLAAFPGAPASEEAQDVLANEGIDLKDHRAVQLSLEQVRRADLIFTMTASQKRHLLELYPEARHKVFVLKEYSDQGLQAGQASRLNEVLRVIEEKKARFQAAHGKRISRLEQERAEILKRLQEIEDELVSWRDLLNEELRPETRELRRLEEELSRYDIPDPFGQSREVYRECAAELTRVIEAAVRRLAEE